jgi:hypothetical protein
VDHVRAYRRALFAGALGVVCVSCLAGGCARQAEPNPFEIAALQAGSFTPLTGVLTQHNDLARTGANLNETILTTSNVNTATFGKLTSLAVSGQVYAQPLYVTAAINGKNVVFIATEANKVYAYNADSPWDLLWSRTDFEQPWASTACANTQPLLGISSTPVIDPASNTIYVVNKTNTGTTFKIMLHVLNMTTGADKVTPFDVSKAADGTTVSVNGTGDGSVGGKLTFDAMRHQNRVGLTLSQGVLSIGFASHCDQNNYHGWLLRFDTTVSPPRPLAPYVTTPNTGHGGFWMGGEGFSVDANGDLYFMSGDGRSGLTDTTGSQLADAFVRLTNVGVSGTPTVGTWFMPSDVASLDTADSDIGSSGPLLIPGTSLLVGGGKNGIFYVLNRTTMGGFRSGSPPEPQIVQRFSPSSNNGQIVGSPVWWESPAGPRLYVWPGKAQLAAFAFDRTSNLFNTTAVAKGVDNPTSDPQGGQLSLSANGSSAGTGIVWGTHPLSSTGGGGAVAGVLYAYNAENVAQKLWDSNQRSADNMASATKYVPPTVANGKVYVGTFSDKVEVYGLFQAPPVDAGAGDAGAPPMLTCSTVDGGAAQPTNWSYVFSTYFAGTTVSSTAGHCQECHTVQEGGFTCGADKDSCYSGLVAAGKVTPDAGTNSPIGDPNRSPLAWFDNPVNPPGVLAFMPSDLAVRNARAVAAVCGWVAAGARNDKVNGQACAGAYECTSGACVDGVCCGSTCTGTCTACTSARTGQPDGTCAAIVSGGADARCPANPPCGDDGTCDGTAHCHVAPLGTSCGAGASCTSGVTQPATICDGSGSCFTPAPQVCAPFVCSGPGCSTTCLSSADCSANAQCAGGTCVTNTGGACTGASQCASGACVDGVCCSSACTGTCMGCSNAKTGAGDGTCATDLAGIADARCGSAPPCGNTGLCASGGSCAVASTTTSCRAASCSGGTATAAANCDGAGACPTPVTTTCSPYACAATACKTTCTADADCVSADYCASGVCVVKKTVGSSCTASNQCGSAFCCNSLCVNAQTDGNNCGSCGHICGAGSGCSSGACSACSITNALIDNFDDNDNVIRPLESRNGLISTYKDALGSTITPAAGSTFTSATPGNGGTGRAAHITGHLANSNSTIFAGVNLDFKNPRVTYDAAYTGFTFWAKKGSSSANGAVRVKVPDVNTDAAGGVCTSCGNDFGTNLTLTTTWTQYTVRFSTLTQESGAGSPRPPSIDATHLYGIKFQSQTKNATYDIWIDDVTFICN